MATPKTVDNSSQVDLSDEERQRNVFWNPFVVFKKDSLENYIVRLSSNGGQRSETAEQSTSSQQREQNKVPSAKLKKLFSRRLSDILGRELNLDSSIDLSVRWKSEEVSATEVDENKNAAKYKDPTTQQGLMGNFSPIYNTAKEKSRLSMYINSIRPDSHLPCIVGSQDSRKSYSTKELVNQRTKVVPVTKTMKETLSSFLKFNRKLNQQEREPTLEEKCQVVYQNDVVLPSSSTTRRSLNVSASQGGIRSQDSRRFFPRDSWELRLWDYESNCRRQSHPRVSTDRLLFALDSHDVAADMRLHSLMTQILYPQMDSFDDVTPGCNLKRSTSDSRKSFGWESKDNSVTDHHISWMDCGSPHFTRNPAHVGKTQVSSKYVWEKKPNSSESNRDRNLQAETSPEVSKENFVKSDAPTYRTSTLLNADSKEGLTPTLPPLRFLPSKRPPTLPKRPSKRNNTSSLDYLSEMLRQRTEAASEKARGSNRLSRVGFKLTPRPTFSPLHRAKRRGGQSSNSAPTRSLADGDGHPSPRKPMAKSVFKKGHKSRAKPHHAAPRRSAKLRLSRQVLRVIQKLLEQIEELEKLFVCLQNREEGLREEMEALVHAYEDSWKNYLHAVSQYSAHTHTDAGDFASTLRALLDKGMQLNNNSSSIRGQRRIIL